jgi:hypothetical protein
MPSKMIIRRQKSASALEAAALGHAGRTGDAVARAFAPFTEEGEAFPDLEYLQRLCARALAHHQRELVLKDEAHLAELSDGAGARDRRDRAAAALLGLLVTLRATCRGAFGWRNADRLLGLGGAMTRDPVVLARKGHRVLEVLRSEAFQLPPPRLPGLLLDVSGWGTQLEEPLLELEAALDEVARDRRRAETTLVAKQEAMADYDRFFRQVSRLLEDLCRLGGLDDLADRLRPSRRSARDLAPSPQAEDHAEASGIPQQPLRLVSSSS